MLARRASNSQQSSCLNLLGAGIVGMCYYDWLSGCFFAQCLAYHPQLPGQRSDDPLSEPGRQGSLTLSYIRFCGSPNPADFPCASTVPLTILLQLERLSFHSFTYFMTERIRTHIDPARKLKPSESQ